MTTKHIQITYKSGKVIILPCKNFSVTSQNGELTKITWELSSRPNDIEPLFIGITDIESIYKIGETDDDTN